MQVKKDDKTNNVVKLNNFDRYRILILPAIVLIIVLVCSISFYAVSKNAVSALEAKYGANLIEETDKVDKMIQEYIETGVIETIDLAIKISEIEYNIAYSDLTINNPDNLKIVEKRDYTLASNTIVVKQYGARIFSNCQDISERVYVPHTVVRETSALSFGRSENLNIDLAKQYITLHSRLLQLFSGQSIESISKSIVVNSTNAPIIVVYYNL